MQFSRSQPSQRASSFRADPVPAAPPRAPPLSSHGRAWLAQRGISSATADALGLRGGMVQETEAVAWPYDGGYKLQAADSSRRRRVLGRLSGLFGKHVLEPSEDLILTEGEADMASFYEAGYRNALSVPHGAGDGAKLAFLDAEADLFERAKRIYLAGDQDEPGEAMIAELARRLGRFRCFRVSYPSDCKDANDVLVRHGLAALKAAIDKAHPFEVPGLQDADDFQRDLLRFRHGEVGQGFSTGLACLDPHFNVAPSCLTVLTGHPGSGKSQFADFIHVHAAETYGWKIGVFSAENPPHMHLAKLIGMRARKRFFDQTDEEIKEHLAWVNEHFIFLTGEQSPTIDSILERLSAAALRKGISSCVVDPFNELVMMGGKREDLEIAEMLGRCTRWCKSHECHMFFVAHPRNMAGSDIPKGEHIAGGAPWRAKADFGMTVHRSQETGLPEIHVWKVRHAHLGRTGCVALDFDAASGRYVDPDYREPRLTGRAIYSCMGEEE